MFNQSTQRKFWILESAEQIQECQLIANQSFIDKRRKMNTNQSHSGEYLTHKEENILLIYYSQYLYDLCRKFRPPVPMTAIGASMTYFKRFFLHTSVMEFHPYHIAYLCIYLAFKVDEYTVSIDQFMAQVTSMPNPQLQMFIIDNELLLIQKLRFHLTIHSPFRPLEGLIIDLKTKSSNTGIENVELYRQNAEKFLAKSLLTYVCLLYTPSQIALAALYCAIGKSFKTYINMLSNNENFEILQNKLEMIKSTVVNFRFPTEADVKSVENKLKISRDPENDPSSSKYHERENTRKEAKEQQKKRKYQELCDMQKDESKMLAYLSD